LIAIVLAVAMTLFWPQPPPKPVSVSTHAIPEKSIAVLPFENRSRDPDNAYFADGIQDEILTRLSKIAELKVISRTSTQHYKSAPENLHEIGRQLGVAHILQGSVQKSGNTVRVNVQLIKGTTDSHLWADTFDRKLTDIFAVESEIAKTIAETLRAKLTGSEQTAIAARPTENTEAYQLYLKGRFFWNKRTGQNLNKAADYFNQAIAADPKYALAYVGLADSYLLMPLYGAGAPQDCYPKAEAAARKAIELDDVSAEAHTSLAQICCYYKLDYPQAIREFQRAIELNPNYATAHQWYAWHLILMGQNREGVSELRKAQSLDPLSLIVGADLADALCIANLLEEAIQQSKKTLELDQHFAVAHYELGQALEQKQRLDEAISEFQKAIEISGHSSVLDSSLAHAYAISGHREDAARIANDLESQNDKNPSAEANIALIYVGLGDKDQAMMWLNKAYHARFNPSILVRPAFDPVRSDPRFKDLLRRIGLPN